MKYSGMSAWLLMIVLLLCSTAFPAGAEEEMRLLSIVAVEGETVWLNTSHGLVPFDKNGWQIGEAMYPGADAYAIGPDGHIYYSIDGDIFEFDRDGNMIDDWNTPLEGFTKLLANDTYILLMSDEAYGAIHAEDHMLAAVAAEGMLDIAFYGIDSFVLMGGADMALIDCATLDVLDITHVSSYGYMVNCSEDEGIYYYEHGSINFLPSIKSETVSYKTLPDKNYVDDVLMDEESVYVIYKGELQVYPRIDDSVGRRVLTIVGGINEEIDMRFTKTVEIFTQRHPEYTVKTTSYARADKAKIAIMANEPGYDILMCDFNGGTEYKIADVLVDFSENSVIADNVSQWLEMPFLWESDGSLYGIPIRLYPYGFRVRKVFWDQFGLDINSDWTWEDFFALAEVAHENGLKLTNDDGVWRTLRRQYESKYRDYIAGIANYDTDTFRKLAAMWKQLNAENMIEYEYINRSNVLLEFDAGIMWMDDRNDYVYLGMPTLDGEYVTPIGMEAFYVNRHSEHAEAAEEFMEIYTSPEVQGWSCGGINTLTEGIADNAFFDMYEEWGILYVVSDMIPSEEEMENLRFALKTGKLNETLTSLDYIGTEIIDDFIADRLTLEEFVAEVQERADLMIGE